MDNEPEYQGHHIRWSYDQVTKAQKKHNYRIPSMAHEKRKAKKEKR